MIFASTFFFNSIYLQGALCVKRYRDSQVAKHKEVIQHAAMTDALRRSEA